MRLLELLSTLWPSSSPTTVDANATTCLSSSWGARALCASFTKYFGESGPDSFWHYYTPLNLTSLQGILRPSLTGAEYLYKYARDLESKIEDPGSYPAPDMDALQRSVAFFLTQQFGCLDFPDIVQRVQPADFPYRDVALVKPGQDTLFPNPTCNLSPSKDTGRIHIGKSIIDTIFPSMMEGLRKKHEDTQQCFHMAFLPTTGIFPKIYYDKLSPDAGHKMSYATTFDELATILDLSAKNPNPQNITHIFATNPDPNGRALDLGTVVSQVIQLNKRIEDYNLHADDDILIKPFVTIVVDETFRFMPHLVGGKPAKSIVEEVAQLEKEDKGYAPYCLLYSHNKSMGTPGKAASFAYESSTCPEETSLCRAACVAQSYTPLSCFEAELLKAYNICHNLPAIKDHLNQTSAELTRRYTVAAKMFYDVNQVLQKQGVPFTLQLNPSDVQNLYGPNLMITVALEDDFAVHNGLKAMYFKREGADYACNPASIDFSSFLRDELNISTCPSAAFLLPGIGFRILLSHTQPGEYGMCTFDESIAQLRERLMDIPRLVINKKTEQHQPFHCSTNVSNHESIQSLPSKAARAC